MEFDPESVRFGKQKFWREFGERNQAFLAAYDRLAPELEKIFLRTMTEVSKIDAFVFWAGRLTMDDFFEILTVCGNAEAHAGQKLLRTMFERVVTMLYLQKNPNEIDDYLDFFWVGERKLLRAIEDNFAQGVISEKRRHEAEARYAEVEKRFKTAKCDKCGYARMPSWTQRDLVTMAKDVGLEAFIVPAYYLPLQQAHPTMHGLLARLELTAEGGFTLGDRCDSGLADRVLLTAHGLLLRAVQAQVEQFGLDAEVRARLEQDFSTAWAPRVMEAEALMTQAAQAATPPSTSPTASSRVGEH